MNYLKAISYVVILAVFTLMVGCDETPVDFSGESPSFDRASAQKKGSSPGTTAEEAGSNLSFPVIWSDGITMPVPGTFGEEQFDGASFEKAGDTWYVQRDPLNVWQAESETLEPDVDPQLAVSSVDWGDNLEAKSWPFGSQVRVETVLYQSLGTPMIAYTMMIEDETVSGLDEVWGTNGVTYPSSEATVYSGGARLVIQQLPADPDDPAAPTLTWNGEEWTVDGQDDVPVMFEGGVWSDTEGPSGYSAEVNVQGKVIYGYNWVTRNTANGPGHYRITFELDESAPVNLNTIFDSNTGIVSREEGEEVAITEEPDVGGGTAQVVPDQNLTYIDVELTVSKGGSGGGNGGAGNGQGGNGGGHDSGDRGIGNGNGGGQDGSRGVGGGNGGGRDGDRGIGGGNGGGQDGNRGKGGSGGGDLYGDMYVILRDVNGVPILTEEGYVQPVDAYGDPLELDEEGHLVNEEDAIEVELGRLNNVRSPERVILRALDEVTGLLSQADVIETDAGGRLVMTIDGEIKTTDSPIENLALYGEMVNHGSVQVSLQPGVTIEDGLAEMFDNDTSPDTGDLLVAKSFLAAAADKAVPLTIDKIMYTHAIMGVNGAIEQNGFEYIAFVDDPVRGVDGLDFAYDREAIYGDVWVEILVETSPGVYERQTVNVFEFVFGSEGYSETGGVAVYTQAADDAREVINFVHEYEVPAL